MMLSRTKHFLFVLLIDCVIIFLMNINVKEYVAYRKQIIKDYVTSQEGRTPHLVIIQVNNDEASNAYVRGKIKDSNEVGIRATLIKLEDTISEEELLKKIDEINHDDDVDGLIVQMPLPKQINEEKVKLAVSPEKDVDGFHPLSHLDPCTPKGILNILKHLGEVIMGKNAVIIGRSNIVGKPMARLLLKESANVTVLHSKTTREDMERYISNADIIVIAIGKKYFLDHSFKYKDSAVVVDVGINRIDGVLYGDAMGDLPVRIKTPVPGGVGLLTRLTLLENLIEIYKGKKA